MSTTVITGIAELVTNDPTLGPGPLGLITDAALIVTPDDDGSPRVEWVGPARAAPAADRQVDVDGRAVVPGFVDSHTHLIFGGDRTEEFAARMSGQAYTGGGIATTVAATREASTRVLRERMESLVAEARAQGTTTMEI